MFMSFSKNKFTLFKKQNTVLILILIYFEWCDTENQQLDHVGVARGYPVLP